MYWFPSASWQAIKEMGLRAVLGLVLIDSSVLEGKRKNRNELGNFKKKII